MEAMGGIVAETFLAVFLIFAIATLEEIDLGVAFESKDMGADSVEEPTVVADNYCTTCEVFKTFFKCAHGVDVDIVSGLVEEQYVGFALEGKGKMETVTFAT